MIRQMYHVSDNGNGVLSVDVYGSTCLAGVNLVTIGYKNKAEWWLSSVTGGSGSITLGQHS